MSAQTQALSLRRFALGHPRAAEDLWLLEDVRVDVARGAFVLLVGDSGSGKSSLLRLICGLFEDREPPPLTRGEIEVLGERIRGHYPSSLRGQVVAVLQDEGLLDELSPRENVELALRVADRSIKLAPGLLAQAGLHQPPDQVAMLSGGMRKRVAVARALATDPAILVFDEPTAGLDPRAAREIAELLKSTHDGAQGRRTTLVVTHDFDAFEGLADATLWIDRSARRIATIEPGQPIPRTKPRNADAAAVTPADPTLRGIQRILLGAGAFAATIGEAITRLPPVHLGVVVRSVVQCVLESVLFVVLASVTIGGLATFFALRNNPLEGAFVGQLLTGVGKVLVAVLVPLMAGFFFTARMAAGAAARVGTMKRTNQVAALQMIGVRPADWLLTPLVWGFCIAMPIVTFAGIVFACGASYLAARLVAGLPDFGWAASFFRTVELLDAHYILLKTVLSGFLVAVLTYHLAVGPKPSGKDVGDSVNASIVLGMVTVLIVHATVTLVGYV